MKSNWESKRARQVRRNIEEWMDEYVPQGKLADWMMYSRTSVQSWEKGRARPEPGVRFMHHMLLKDPGFILEIKEWSDNERASQQQTSEDEKRA